MLLLLVIYPVLGYYIPEQIHLSWTENPLQMRVTWLTSFNLESLVELHSTNCNELVEWKSVEASSRKFNFGTKNLRYKYVNTAVMSGLKENCLYEYKVYNGNFSSKAYTFQGRTPGIDNYNNYTIAIVGDLGIGKGSRTTMKAMDQFMAKFNPLGAFHLGDISYNLNTAEGTFGDLFGNLMQSITARYAYMTIPGNHERFKHFSHYLARYIMPKTRENKGTGLFYSFNIGYIHYVFLNTNIFKLGTEKEKNIMLKWFVKDLKQANNNRKDQPWVVVISHHPLYCFYQIGSKRSYKDCIKRTRIFREYLEDIYYKNSVDLVISGHLHNYQRMGSIYKNKYIKSEYETDHLHINSRAPIYIISGNGGTTAGFLDPEVKTLSPWYKAQVIGYGFGSLTCLNKDEILWKQYDSADKSVVDYVKIVKRN